MFNPEHKKVKIVATLGPASDDPKMIHILASRGVDVFRFNLTHAFEEELRKRTEAIRAVEKKLKRPLAIMGDLGGPKIRTSVVDREVQLEPGQKITIVKKLSTPSHEAISLNFPEIVDSLEVGAEVYLNDGLPKLEVEKKISGGVVARVVVGGTLKSKMGFSAQGLAVKKFKLAEKDKQDIKLMAKLGADALAISFVQSADDIRAVRAAIPKGYQPMLIAKIETIAGVRNVEEILQAADGLMVARGDLGFAVPMAELPHIQKELIRLALKHSKPVITATQMLESMTTSHLPTRAEVTDVANAILDGTDAVMLSGETARGKYPEEVVRTMVKIIERATQNLEHVDFPLANTTADAVSVSAVRMANQLGSRLIVTFTETGSTARRISRHRPAQPTIALSPNHETIRHLAFSWGVSAFYSPQAKEFMHALPQAHTLVRNNPILSLKKDESFVVCGGLSFGKAGTTNLVVVERA